MNDIRFVVVATQQRHPRSRGRRARRQAFYSGQKMARHMTQLLNAMDRVGMEEALEQAYLDAIALGTGFVSVPQDGSAARCVRPWDMFYRAKEWRQR